MSAMLYIVFYYIFYINYILTTDPSCECSGALSSILTENAKNLSIGNTGHFCVCGQYEWSSSGYLVYEGETYTLSVEGNQTWIDYNHVTTSLGYSNKWVKLICCEDQWLDMSQYESSRRYPSADWSALICCLGRIEDVQDTESCFEIGNSTTKSIQNLPGLESYAIIECYANDIIDLYGDNDEAINVTITRIIKKFILFNLTEFDLM